MSWTAFVQNGRINDLTERSPKQESAAQACGEEQKHEIDTEKPAQGNPGV